MEDHLVSRNEQLLEIRFTPNPLILDKRGAWAKDLVNQMELPEWEIVENRLDVFSKNKSLRVFVSYRNAGVIAKDSPTKNFFQEKAAKFIRYLNNFPEFGHSIYVERLGVRSRFASPFSGSFEKLLNRINGRYFQLMDESRNAIGNEAQLVDLGILLNFKDKHGNFNTNIGPMERIQLSQVFGKSADELPEVALYYDIDYFVRPEGVMSNNAIVAFTKDCADESWSRHQRIQELILGN